MFVILFVLFCFSYSYSYSYSCSCRCRCCAAVLLVVTVVGAGGGGGAAAASIRFCWWWWLFFVNINVIYTTYIIIIYRSYLLLRYVALYYFNVGDLVWKANECCFARIMRDLNEKLFFFLNGVRYLVRCKEMQGAWSLWRRHGLNLAPKKITKL